MAARKKKADPAALRTLGLFSKKTVLEEAEALVLEEQPDAARGFKNPLEMVEHGEETAVTWLGLDAFHEGDDVRVAVHPGGHAVLMLVRTNYAGPYGTSLIKLSKAQFQKLRKILQDG